MSKRSSGGMMKMSVGDNGDNQGQIINPYISITSLKSSLLSPLDLNQNSYLSIKPSTLMVLCDFLL